MKKMEFTFSDYSAPELSVYQIHVEEGFAKSKPDAGEAGLDEMNDEVELDEW